MVMVQCEKEIESYLPFYGMEVELVKYKNSDDYFLTYENNETSNLKFYYYYDSNLRSVNHSRLSRYNSLSDVLKKVFHSSLLKVSNGECYGGYKVYVEFTPLNGNTQFINLFSIEVYENKLEYFTGINVPNNISNPFTFSANDLIGELSLNTRKFSFLYDNNEMLEVIPEIKSLGKLIENNIPSKRKSKTKDLTTINKIKADNLKTLNNLKNRIESDYRINSITTIKTYSNLREAFYNHLEDGFKDISKFIKLIYPLECVHLSSISSNHGYYFYTENSIELSRIVAIDRNDKSTLYHEYGHHIYHNLLKDTKMKNLVKEMISEIRKLETIGKIRAKKKILAKENEELLKKGSMYINGLSHYTYLLKETEIFARLFESYMCEKCDVKKVNIEKRFCWGFEKNEIEIFERYLNKFGLLKY